MILYMYKTVKGFLVAFVAPAWFSAFSITYFKELAYLKSNSEISLLMCDLIFKLPFSSIHGELHDCIPWGILRKSSSSWGKNWLPCKIEAMNWVTFLMFSFSSSLFLGTTWTLQIVKCLRTAGEPETLTGTLDDLFPFIESSRDHSVDALNAIPSPRVLKSHG